MRIVLLFLIWAGVVVAEDDDFSYEADESNVERESENIVFEEDYLFEAELEVEDLHEVGFDLVLAAEVGDLARVRNLLREGANPNQTDDYGWTAMHMAAFYGRVAMMGWLILYGADVEARTGTGETPLMCAIRNGSILGIHFLMGLGAEMEVQDNDGCSIWDMLCRVGFEYVWTVVYYHLNLRDRAEKYLRDLAENDWRYLMSTMVVMVEVKRRHSW